MIEDSKFMPLFAAVGALVLVAALLSMPFILEAHAAPSNSVVSGSANVQLSCTIALAPNAIIFGGAAGVPSGSGTGGTVNAIADTNSGDAAATIFVQSLGYAGSGNTIAGNWISGSNSFTVGSTVWAATNGAAGTALTNALVTTAIINNAPATIGGSNTVNVYFGINVPGGVPAGVYTQTINIQNSC
jgi:hypothetical protein